MLRLLVIVDDRELRGMLAAYFSLKDDLDVCIERSGASGLRRIAEQEFDAVVASVSRGPVNHLDIADLMRKRNPSAGVLLVGKGACDPALRAVLDAQGWVYLEEPVSLHCFGELVREARGRCLRTSACGWGNGGGTL